MMELLTGILPMEVDHVIVPPFKARSGWWFNRSAIIEAMKVLGIKYPIKLRFSSGYQFGSHRSPTPEKPFHRITINQGLVIGEANRTLWHELTHASQAESWSQTARRPVEQFYREAYRDGVSYRHKSWELEAESNAYFFEERMLLHG